MIRTIDNFLPAKVFEKLRASADHWVYGDVENPADGAVYPGIHPVVVGQLREVIIGKLAVEHDAWPEVRFMFLRLSTEGTLTHERYHSDISMGQYTLVLYLNRLEHCQGGTDMVAHCSGFDSAPQTDLDYECYIADQDKPDAWETYYSCQMKPNRALIVDAELLHAAKPFGGFGKDATDGRLVLCCFYEVQ